MLAEIERNSGKLQIFRWTAVTMIAAGNIVIERNSWPLSTMTALS
jgi:hypothetical protein